MADVQAHTVTVAPGMKRFLAFQMPHVKLSVFFKRYLSIKYRGYGVFGDAKDRGDLRASGE